MLLLKAAGSIPSTEQTDTPFLAVYQLTLARKQTMRYRHPGYAACPCCDYLTARHAACVLRGKRRAGLRCARVQAPPDCLRKLRQTGFVASFNADPLVTAHTPPLRPSPQTAGQGLAAPGGLRCTGPERRRMLRNRLSGFGRLGLPSLPLAWAHWQARLSPSLPRPRTALHFPARVRLLLR